MQYGMNLNPRHPVGRPADINALRGVKWARIVFSAAASRETIQQAFNVYDHQVNQYKSIGMNTLMVLNQETFWGHGPWDHGNWERYAREFAAAIKLIVERYRGKGVAYQIWNEGDIQGHSSIFVPAAEFAKVLRDAYAIIKATDPGAIVVHGGLAAGAGDAVKYIADIRAALGGKLPVDAIGIHPYGQWTPNFGGTPNWGGWHGKLQDYMWHINRGMPRNVPLWITEIGISENVVFPSSQYPMVVKYLDGLNQFLRSNYSSRVPVMIWFAWSDIMRQAGICDYGNNPKRAVYDKFFDLASKSDSELPTTGGSPDTQFGILLKPTVKLSIRDGAGTTFKRVATVDINESAVALDHPLTVQDKIGKDNAWLKIRTPSGTEGYAAAWYLELGDVMLRTTASGGLNIRAGAGTTYDRVGSVIPTDPMICLEPLANVAREIGTQGEWLHVRLADGTEGYAAAWLVDKVNDAPAPTDSGDTPDDTDTPDESDDDVPTKLQKHIFLAPTVNLNLRSEPQVADNRLTTMKEGSCLLMVDDPQGAMNTLGEGGWIKVKMSDGTAGWTSAQYLKRIEQAECADFDQFDLSEDEETGGGEVIIEPAPILPIFVAPTTRLNARSAPEIGNNVLDVLDAGECVLIVDDPQKAFETLGKSGWLKIRRANAKEGWVSAQYLTHISDPQAICADLSKFDVSLDDLVKDDGKDDDDLIKPIEGEFIADGFDAPVGSAEERASDDMWPGEWFDPTGYAENTYSGYVKNWNAYHTGADLNLNRPRWNADKGAPVYSIASGIVTYAEFRVPSWGNLIVIKHDPLPDGTVAYSRYGHLARMDVSKGTRVERGTVIGTIGSNLDKSGKPYVGAEHLHFDVSVSDKLQDSPGDWPRKDLKRLKTDYADPVVFIAENRPKKR
ncbi:MAG: SH3 domain-containing protein [Aggregatilineales bacterium]